MMIIALLIKFMYMLSIHMKQDINILLNKVEKWSYLKDPTAFIEYSNNTQDVYKNIEEYNPSKCNVLIVFDDMISDTISNKSLSPVVIELFIRRRKLNDSTVFITQSYFQLPKDVRLNFTRYLL